MIALRVVTAIVVPSVLLTFAVRRWIAPVRWRTAALMIALAFVFVARGLFCGRVPLALDDVLREWPYKGVYHVTELTNFLTNDTVKEILPWMAVAREELAHGRVPLWDRYLFCGYPLLGNGQSAPFSPFFLITLFVPLPHQLVAMAGLKLFVALIFGFLLLRREGCGEAAALFGSAVFAFAIFNSCFLYYPMTAVTLLLPAAVYAFLVVMERYSVAHFILAIVVVAALLAGGHPESVMHVAMAVVALILIEAFAPAAGVARGFTRAVAAALIGAAIAAPAWFPVLAMTRISGRVAWLKTIPLGWSSSPKALWAAVQPDGFGNPAHHDWSWYAEYPLVASTYLGLIVLVIVIATIARGGATWRDRLLLIAGALFFLVAEGWTPIARLFYVAPPFSWVAHDRLLFVVVFIAGVVAARALMRITTRDVLAICVVALVVLLLFSYVWLKTHGRTLHGAAAFAGVAALIVFLISLGSKFRAPAALVCTVIELFVLTADYNAPTPAEWYAPRLPIVEKMRSLAPNEPWRFVGRDWVMLPNAAAQYGVEDIRGSDPMEWNDYRELFPAQDPDQAAVGLRRFADANDPWLDLLNVRFLMTEPGAGLGGKWRLVYSGADGELYENQQVRGRFFTTDGHVETRMLSPMHYRVRVEAPRPELVSSSMPDIPGWTAHIGRRRLDIVRSQGPFLGFSVKKGVSEVEVEYRSRPFESGLYVGFVGVVAGVWAGFGIRRRGKGLSGVPSREAAL